MREDLESTTLKPLADDLWAAREVFLEYHNPEHRTLGVVNSVPNGPRDPSRSASSLRNTGFAKTQDRRPILRQCRAWDLQCTLHLYRVIASLPALSPQDLRRRLEGKGVSAFFLFAVHYSDNR